MNNGTNFGATLKKVRLKKGFSQEHLAEVAHLDRSYISLLERGERHPTVITLFALAKALDISPSSIVADMEKSK